MKQRGNLSILIILGLIFAALFSVYLFLQECGMSCHKGKEVIDTITYRDTISYYKPIPKEHVKLRYDTIHLQSNKQDVGFATEQVTDSGAIKILDSTKVVIPITQKVYEDSTYKAWVSGYNPNIDSIFVYQKTTVVNHYFKDKEKRFGLGIQCGYGLNNNKMQPYIGIGVSYNLLKW
jgi:hypothetical protein